jgi:hypothetical protein
MLTEAFHRTEADRHRRLAQMAKSALIARKMIEIAELHSKIADLLQRVPSARPA